MSFKNLQYYEHYEDDITIPF